MKNITSLFVKNPNLSKCNQVIVVKSNDLIEARYRLSLQESHVILWLLTQIKPEDEDFKVHAMQISEFSKMIAVDPSNQYKELRKVTMRLIQRGLSIYEHDKQEWLQVTWLNSARYKTKEGIVELKFSSDLKPYLLQLKSRFTKLEIVDAMKFKSIYAVRIFELLVQYTNIGSRITTINDIREWCGIKKDEYKLYGHLKQDVLTRAKKEINNKTAYEIEYSEIKQSRKVIAIKWIISKKSPIKESTQKASNGNIIPINYEGCPVPEMITFCKDYVNTLPRDQIDYLLNAQSLMWDEKKLIISFSSRFFQDRCDTEDVKNKLMEFFKVKEIALTIS